MSKAVTVIGRSAHERQAERDVDAVIEGERLDRDQRLVVIHTQGNVVAGARASMEQRVGGQRADRVDAFGAQRRDRGGDDVAIFLAERTVLAGVRVQARDGETRFGDAETFDEVARGDAAGFDDQILAQAADDILERQMDGHRHNGQFGRPQQHDRMRGAAGRFLGEPGEEFGMARLGETGAIKDVLGDGIGDHGGGAPGDDVGDGAADRRDRRRRAGVVGCTGPGADLDVERRHRQRMLECRDGVG